jgi:hypothetical protein
MLPNQAAMSTHAWYADDSVNWYFKNDVSNIDKGAEEEQMHEHQE